MKATGPAYRSDGPSPTAEDYRIAAEEPHFGAGENTDEAFDLETRLMGFQPEQAQA